MSDVVENTSVNEVAEQATVQEPAQPQAPTAETAHAAGASVDVEALQARLAEAEEKARKWAEFEESQKSEQQRMAEKITKLEALNAKLQAEAEIRGIATKYGIKAEDMVLLGGGDVKSAEEKARRLAEVYKAVGVPSGQSVERGTASPGSGDKEAPMGDAYPREWLPPALRK